MIKILNKYFVIDFEFTFYKRPVGRPSGFFNEIIEAGAVLMDSAGTEIGSMHSFVKPHFYPRHAKDAFDFCMITEKEMKNAIEFPEMVNQISNLYVPGESYFVTWGDDDFKVLETGCKRHGIDNPICFDDCLDLALAYKLWKGDDFTSSLKAAAEGLEADTKGLWHTAYDDAANTSKVLFKMIEKGWNIEEFFAAMVNETE